MHASQVKLANGGVASRAIADLLGAARFLPLYVGFLKNKSLSLYLLVITIAYAIVGTCVRRFAFTFL